MASKSAEKGRAKGTGNINKIRNRFYFRYTINGKVKNTLLRNRDGSPVKNRLDAVEAAKLLTPILAAQQKEELALHVAEAKKLRKQSGLLLSNAWETYLEQPNRPENSVKTLQGHQGNFQLFLTWLKDKHPEVERVAEVDGDIAKEYFTYLWGEGIAARTYNIYLSGLRLIFKHLADIAALDVNPFDAVVKKQEEKISRKEFTAEQVEAIFRGFDKGFFYETEVENLTVGRERKRSKVQREYKPMYKEEMRVLMNLCCWIGCRGQDGCLMTWDNVNLNTDIIRYVPKKTARRTGGRVVTLPLHPNLKAALVDAIQWNSENQSGENYILPHVAQRYKTNPTGIQKDVMKIIRCATGLATTLSENHSRRKINANAYSLHSFRHTFVSFCANAGVPLAVVAEIIGHGSPAMTRHYSHISNEAKKEAIAVLPVLALTVPPVTAIDVEVVEPESDDSNRQQLLCAINQLSAEEIAALLVALKK